MEGDISAPTSMSGSVDITTNLETQALTTEPSFRDLLSDEYKSNKSLESYKDLNSLVKSHLELNKMLGNSVRVPGEDATDEQKSKFYSKLGRPEEPSKYELSNPESLPEGFEINEEGLNQFKELAFKLGLSTAQANSLREHYLNQSIEQHKASYVSEEQKESEFLAKSAEMFGDKSQQIMSTAAKLIAENLTPEQGKLLDGLNNDSLLAMTTLLNNVSNKYLKPDSVSTKYTSANTAEDSRKELSALLDKQEKIILSSGKFDPEYKIVDEKIKALYANGIKLF